MKYSQINQPKGWGFKLKKKWWLYIGEDMEDRPDIVLDYIGLTLIWSTIALTGWMVDWQVGLYFTLSLPFVFGIKFLISYYKEVSADSSQS